MTIILSISDSLLFLLFSTSIVSSFFQLRHKNIKKNNVKLLILIKYNLFIVINIMLLSRYSDVPINIISYFIIVVVFVVMEKIRIFWPMNRIEEGKCYWLDENEKNCRWLWVCLFFTLTYRSKKNKQIQKNQIYTSTKNITSLK